MELHPYTCKNCGAPIDVVHMRCTYCGTAYEDESLKKIVIRTERPGEYVIRANVAFDTAMVAGAPAEVLRDATLRELRNQLADGLLGFIKLTTNRDPRLMMECIRGEVRVIDPYFDGY